VKVAHTVCSLKQTTLPFRKLSRAEHEDEVLYTSFAGQLKQAVRDAMQPVHDWPQDLSDIVSTFAIGEIIMYDPVRETIITTKCEKPPDWMLFKNRDLLDYELNHNPELCSRVKVIQAGAASRHLETYWDYDEYHIFPSKCTRSECTCGSSGMDGLFVVHYEGEVLSTGLVVLLKKYRHYHVGFQSAKREHITYSIPDSCKQRITQQSGMSPSTYCPTLHWSNRFRGADAFFDSRANCFVLFIKANHNCWYLEVRIGTSQLWVSTRNPEFMDAFMRYAQATMEHDMLHYSPTREDCLALSFPTEEKRRRDR